MRTYVMQESSCLFAQTGERPRLYKRLLYSAGHPTSGVRHNDEQEQYNDIVTGVKENYSAEPSVVSQFGNFGAISFYL